MHTSFNATLCVSHLTDGCAHLGGCVPVLAKFLQERSAAHGLRERLLIDLGEVAGGHICQVAIAYTGRSVNYNKYENVLQGG
jgi:hypothetical protein